MNVYLGLDPGASGGLAALIGRVIVSAPMSATDRDIWDWLSRYSSGECCAALEKVGGYIGRTKDGIVGGGQPGSAAFKFGASYGALRMALVAARIPFVEVIPRTWQKAVGIAPRKSGETKSSHKNRLKARAQELFPSAKVTLAVADAILLAEYCHRAHNLTRTA